MARQVRLEYPGAVWHVHNRGNNYGDIFFCDDDRQLFVDLLGETARRYHWNVLQYQEMTNHYHLLIETPETTLSHGMKWFAQVYVQRINKRHGRVGSLYQGRFKSHLVEKGPYLLNVMRYIANNPVQAGMVKRAEDWKWGSHRAIAGFAVLPEWMSNAPVLTHFGPDRATQLREYRKFVDAGAGIERAPWEDAIDQLFIGSQEWIASMRSLLESKPRSSDHPVAQRYAARPKPARVSEIVADVFETTPHAIRSSHGTDERMVVAWLGCYESMARLGSIATVLLLRSTSRVSALITECDRRLARDKTLRIAVDRCLDRLRAEATPVRTPFREHYPGTQHASI